MGLMSAPDIVGQSPMETSRLREARKIIEREFATPLTTQRLARRVRLPRVAFYTGFRDCFGQTPEDCLRCVRMREAAALLEQGLVHDAAALQVGYGSTRSFIADYRRTYREDAARLRLLSRQLED